MLPRLRDELNFIETYNIPPEVMALLVADDVALLDFGLNFLKHVLFGKKFIEEYPDAYEKRLARKRERAQQAQQAAFDTKLALEDDKYSSYH